MHKRTDEKVCHCHECREERHFIAWKLYQKDVNQCIIAEVLGVTEGAISQWINKAKQEGPKALESEPHPGRETKLSKSQKQNLQEMLKKGAEAFGFTGEVWTSKRIAKLIEDQFGITYSASSVRALLNRMGWSYHKPKKRASKRDQEQIDQWVNQDWPRIKKKPEPKGG